jgi:uncharacterized protein (TIGR04255 family)
MPQERSKKYAKPPIVEATVEVRTGDLLDRRHLERCRDRFKKKYEKVEDLSEITIAVAPGGAVTHLAKPLGHKLTSANAVDVLMLGPSNIGISRLAPYVSWEALIGDMRQDYELYTKVVGRKSVVRIGARYQNRIDVPKDQMKDGGWPDFVTVMPSIPLEIAGRLGNYYMNVQPSYRDTKVKLVIQTGPANEVLLDHASLQLDIDAYIDSDLPTRVDLLWDEFARLRDVKNAVFENCITEATRKLFE